jgi:hypothetical protein
LAAGELVLGAAKGFDGSGAVWQTRLALDLHIHHIPKGT